METEPSISYPSVPATRGDNAVAAAAEGSSVTGNEIERV